MSDLGMWKCPNCETLNKENFCHVCGTPRPQMSNPPMQNSDGGKNKGLLIALVAIVAVLLIVIAIFVGYTLMNRDTTSDVVNNAAVTEVVPDEQIFYVNKFDDSGIYVRSGPGKDYNKILYIEKGDQTVHLRYLNEKAKGDDNWFWYHVETPSGDMGYVREDVVVKWEKE